MPRHMWLRGFRIKDCGCAESDGSGSVKCQSERWWRVRMLFVAKCLHWFEMEGEKRACGMGCIGSATQQSKVKAVRSTSASCSPLQSHHA